MNRHLAIVSSGFTWAGALLGLPSLAALLYLLYAWLEAKPPSPTVQDGVRPEYDSFIDLLMSGTEVISKALRLFLQGAQWAITLLGLIAAISLALGLALVAVGRGIHAQQTWGRILGMLLSSGMLLVAACGAALFRLNVAGAMSMLIAAMCVYVFGRLPADSCKGLAHNQSVHIDVSVG